METVVWGRLPVWLRFWVPRIEAVLTFEPALILDFSCFGRSSLTDSFFIYIASQSVCRFCIRMTSDDQLTIQISLSNIFS
jgi:hypothetical protein